MSTLGWNTVVMPSFPTPAQVDWKRQNLIPEAKSGFTGQSQIYDWNVGYLEAVVTMPPMPDARSRPWLAFVASCDGIKNAFMFADPIRSSPMGTGGTATVSGSNQTGRTLVTTFGSGAVLPGDLITVNFRMFEVLSNSSGTLGIWPPLKEPPPNGATITTANPSGLFRMKTNEGQYSQNPSRIIGIKFDIVEAF